MHRQFDLGTRQRRRQEWIDWHTVRPFVVVLLRLAKYIRSAMETMLANGFQPARTVVLASGFDEESSGTFVR